MYRKLALYFAGLIVLCVFIFFSTPVESLFKISETSVVEIQTPILTDQDRTHIKSDFITRINVNANRALNFPVPVTEKTVEFTIDMIRKMNQSSRDPIFIVLNSPGGEVDAGMRLMSAIQGSRAPVTAIVDGECASMCTYIFEVAKHRYMVPRSTLMFHQASITNLSGEYGKLKSRILYWTEQMDTMNAAVADRAGMVRKKFLNSIQNEYYLSSEKALSLHFSDGTVFLDIKK